MRAAAEMSEVVAAAGCGRIHLTERTLARNLVLLLRCAPAFAPTVLLQRCMQAEWECRERRMIEGTQGAGAMAAMAGAAASCAHMRATPHRKRSVGMRGGEVMALYLIGSCGLGVPLAAGGGAGWWPATRRPEWGRAAAESIAPLRGRESLGTL